MAEARATKITELTPDVHNANKGTERGLALLDKSLRQYGAGRSILVDKNGRVIAGNKTLERAADIGLDDVLVVQTDGRQLVAVQRTDLDLETDKAARELAYADNRVGEIDLTWNVEQLVADLESGIDLDGMWSDGELAELMGNALNGDADAEPQIDKAEELRVKWGVETGQLWQLGEHRLICGDCTDKAVVEHVMAGEKAALVVTDPPYGMRLDADFSKMVNSAGFQMNKGLKRGNKYANVIGDDRDYDAAPLMAAFEYVKEQFWFGADYYADTLGDTRHTGAWLVWDKRLEESADKMFGSCFELIWSRQKHKRDILRHKWAGVFGTEQPDEGERSHPNQKPVTLYCDILERYSAPNAIIVDCYAGSGTMLVACERAGRQCRAVEISPAYCAVAIQRWVDVTAGEPVLVD